MAQGWTIDPTADTITFIEAPPVGTGNVVVTQYAAGAVGGTDCWALGAWSGEFGYPTEVEFFSDRLWWAGTQRDPQMIWGSNAGDYSNHGKSTPIIDSDSVSFAINARQVNAVMDLVPLDKMIVMAKGGEFLMSGGQDDVITPSTIAIKPQSYRGTGRVQGRVAGDTAIFVQEQGSRIYDIGYRFDADGYRPQDISVWAEHLVIGHQLLFVEWMPAPLSCLWFVRDDGVLLGCTYMPDQEVIGWHRHDTDGEILDVVCMPGALQTETHVLVRRTINGVAQVYLEQLADLTVEDPMDYHYVDSGVTYDGRNATATTLTLSGGTDWTEFEVLTLTASAPLFVGASDEGDAFTIRVGDNGVRVRIDAYVSATVVEVSSVGTVPEALRGVASADWTFMRDTISGLDHLEGKAVAILADGSVVTNGFTEPATVVTGGAITLAQPAGVVQVGLPYRAHLETLHINASDRPMRGASKLVDSVGLVVKDTRGIKAGARLDYLEDLPQREFENYDEPTAAGTGYYRVPVTSTWGENAGKVHVVSDDPLPAEILSIIPSLVTGDR